MAGGFRSPAIVVGYSGPSVPVQGGYITLPWFQAGGATAPTQGGYYTLPWWQAGGGVGEDPVVVVTTVKGGGERKRLTLSQQKRLTPLKKEEVFPEGLTDLAKTAILEREVEVDNTILRVSSAPELPSLELKADLIELSQINNIVEREIASLMRTQEQQRYLAAVAEFQKDAQRFEEEFLILLLLTVG